MFVSFSKWLTGIAINNGKWNFHNNLHKTMKVLKKIIKKIFQGIFNMLKEATLFTGVLRWKKKFAHYYERFVADYSISE